MPDDVKVIAGINRYGWDAVTFIGRGCDFYRVLPGAVVFCIIDLCFRIACGLSSPYCMDRAVRIDRYGRVILIVRVHAGFCRD